MKKILFTATMSVLLCCSLSKGQDSAVPIKNGDLKIPSSWKLVTVTKDREVDDLIGFTLWFQDRDGTVYAITTTRHLDGHYHTTSEITKFSATTNSAPALPPK